MKTFLKLVGYDLKMLFRNKQSLFWSLAFPLLFTVIFGLFFGRENNFSGTVAFINNSKNPIATNLEKSFTESKLFNINSEKNLDSAKDLVSKNKISGVVYIPENFAAQTQNSTNEIQVFYDPASTQTSQILNSFINSYLTQASFQIQNSKPLFKVNSEAIGISSHEFSYFDFVLSGLLGLALMNSSVIGISVGISTYREEKILKRITTTPLRSWVFIGAEVLSRLILNVVQIGLILAVGVWGFHGHIYGSVGLLFALALLGGVLFQLLGFIIASFAKNPDAAQSMSQAITVPMMFLGGVFFPLDALPKWLFSIVQFLPLAPLLRVLRSVSLDAASPWQNPLNFAIIGGWIVVALVITILRFRLSEE